ncbi:MAG TPA: amino acid adenylation domain-containing protein [Longimicrobium sp.]|nr:amino acid adenylation domain-containing protein [Longimicrobium sp.]
MQDTPARPELSAAKRALLEARLFGLHRPTAIVPRPPGVDVPLSPDQERFWFLDRLGQGGTAYNIYAGLRLQGGTSEAAMERALGEIVRRHESLRTTFREVDGVPQQVVAPFTGFSLPAEDLSALPADEREAEVTRRFTALATHPFDLTAGPLFIARLLRLGGGEHVLLLNMHHMVSDGWSMRVLYRELWTLYAAYRDGHASPLPELEVQYGDWAVWQRAQPQRQAEAKHLEYWTRQLAGAPELLELPYDHPRPPAPSFRGGTVPVSVPLDVLERLRELGKSEGATLFMVVLAAFKVLLGRWAGHPDVVVGTPVAGRTRKETEALIGLFVNEIVLRTDLSGDPTFRELVGRVREVVMGGYDHQEVPFERVVEALRPQRTLSHAALFQVVFQLDNLEAQARDEGVRVREVDVERGTTKMDLTLGLDAHAHGITGVLDYSSDLFDRGTARRMAEQLERLLGQASRDPGRRISRLELMGQPERQRIISWNRTTANYPAERCIHQLWEEQAARTPNAVALVDGSNSLTFAQVDARANRLAHHLRGLGVRPEVRVGVCLERGWELLVAMIGVMKAGGAWVPADPAHPADRLAYVFGDSSVHAVLTQERLRGRLPVYDRLPVIALDTAWARIEAEPADAPESGVTAENLAYVIYTSGSTGRPKGVAMHHRGVSNYIHWGVRAYGAGEGNGAPVFSSMAVDLTITNLLPLFAGKPVRMLPEESPVEALAAALREAPGFGMIKITPIHLGLLNTMLAAGEAPAAARTLVIGADFLSAEPTVFWQRNAPGVRLMNEYGPTETVVGCSAYVLPTGKHQAGPVPVGHPIQNLRFYVLDAHLQPVPVGLPGELYIGGAGVARGYLGRAALTAEKFVPEPFAGPGARMYRTGDRARWLADGNLVILGRTDNQVKVRGYRVELGEIEAVLRRRPGVRECVVILREDRPGDRRLVAYVVADGNAADARVLREHLLATLPEYMVPAAFVLLPALPQTPTGKLDRKTLPAPDYGAHAAPAAAPADEVETELARIWEEVLGFDGIGPEDDFFALGGNSLMALRLFAQVNRALGCELPVATLFTGATVRHMAGAVRAQRRAAPASASPLVALRDEGTLPPLFCVHPAGRDVIGYAQLVRHLDAGRPVIGIRDVGDDLARPIPTVAAEHVRALRQRQPEGPYHLVGWSFGGYVAWEMAAQLEAEGERVAFVGLLDTMSPLLAQVRHGYGDVELAAGLAEEAAEQMGRDFTIDRGALEGLPLDEVIRRAVAQLHAQGAAPADFDAAALREGFDVIRARARSLRAYVPGRYAGPLTLFRPAVAPPDHAEVFGHRTVEEERTLGWSALASGPVDVHRVPGTHATLGSGPNVQALAHAMARALAAASPASPEDGGG